MLGPFHSRKKEPFVDDDYLSRLPGVLARARVAAFWTPDPGENMDSDFLATATAVTFRASELEHDLFVSGGHGHAAFSSSS